MSEFYRDTAVEQVQDDLWRGELVHGWRIGEVPNGGYVLAVAGRVLEQTLPHQHPLTVSAFYLAPTALGPVDCQVEVLGRGRGTSHGAVKMYQDGQLKVQVTAAYTDLERLHGETWSAEPRPQFPSWDDCQQSGQKLEFRERVDIQLVTGSEVFKGKEPNGTGEFSGWMRFTDGSDPDPLSLLMFADAFPPPALSLYGPVGWVPTMELSVQVRALPAPGPLQCRFRTRYVTHGVLEEDGEIWDSAGQLVCLSRQCAKIRLA